MKSSCECLSQDAVEMLLGGNLTPQVASEVESHLEHCQMCRQRVENEIGPADWWCNVGRWLRDEIGPGQFDLIGHSIRQSNTDDDEIPSTKRSGDRVVSELLDLLSPTEYPEMLGQIGPYEIAGILGYGGMGGVFKGFDRSLHRFVAIKMMLPHLAVSAASRARFAREAKAIAAVVDDHVMAIHGVDQWKSLPYFVMPLLRGESLQTRLNDRGQLGTREILRISMQAAKGLAAAHAQGIIHRDVKPANIFLDGETDRAQLMDFGIALAVDDPSLTKTGILTGTPQFMSPEQARGEAVTAASDLFSLGGVIYSMTTGHAPFQAETTYGVLRLITDKSVAAMQSINPDSPPWLDHIVSKLMAKEPGDRFGSAQEVADLLQGCLAHTQQPSSVPLPKQLEIIRPLDDRLIDRNRLTANRTVKVVASFCFAMFGLTLISQGEMVRPTTDQVVMLPHRLIKDGSDKLTVAQIWDRWKEMPLGSWFEQRAKDRLLNIYHEEIAVEDVARHISRRRQWAIEILPLVTSGVIPEKANFLLLFLHPFDPNLHAKLELSPSNHGFPRSNPSAASKTSPAATGGLDQASQIDFETSAWDIQTTLAMTLGRAGRHTDAALVIDTLADQIQAKLDEKGGRYEVQFLGYRQSLQSAMSWCCFYRATIQNMTVITLEKNLEDQPNL